MLLLLLLLLLLLYSPLCFCGSLFSVVGASSIRTPRLAIATTTTACTTSLAFVAKLVNNEPVLRCLMSGGNKRHSATVKHYYLSSTASTASSIVREDEIKYIAGRRALLLHPKSHPSSMSKITITKASPDEPNNVITKHSQHPPLVVLGGMAQSITNWEFHLSFLSQHRSVLMYEPIGQGPTLSSEYNSTPDQYYYNDVSLQRQGEDFWNVVDEAFFTPGSHYYDQHYSFTGCDAISTIDVASFSFGGRISLAAATLRPNRIRRLHLTGVGAERDSLANIHIACWRDLLSINANDEVDCNKINHSTSRCSSRLRSFAWAIIFATYSEQFLATVGPDRIKLWVESVCQTNTEEGLRAILTQAHDNGTTDQHSWTPAAMAQRIQASQSIQKYRILVGSKDVIAHPSQALRLAEMLHVGDDDDEAGADFIKDDVYKVVDGCGHSVPMEAMRVWREDVLQFLSSGYTC